MPYIGILGDLGIKDYVCRVGWGQAPTLQKNRPKAVFFVLKIMFILEVAKQIEELGYLVQA